MDDWYIEFQEPTLSAPHPSPPNPLYIPVSTLRTHYITAQWVFPPPISAYVSMLVIHVANTGSEKRHMEHWPSNWDIVATAM